MKGNMFRWAFFPAAVLFLSTLGATSGKAQTNVVLGLGTSTDELNLTGTGSMTIDVNDRTCTGGTCFFAAGSAYTAGDSAFTSGTYTMTTGSSPLAFALTPGATATSYTVNQTNPISFMYSSSGGNLTGNLSFLSATTSPVGSGGVSLVFLVGNLAVTGGSLSSDFHAGVPANVTLDLYNSLSSLLNGTMTASSEVLTGNIATPEPGSIFLFGSGLLALGLLLKKSRNLSFTHTV